MCARTRRQSPYAAPPIDDDEDGDDDEGKTKRRKLKLKPPAPTEAEEQAFLAGWLTFRKLLWCHVPNGGRRHIVAARALKAQGVSPGVPDILIFTPPPNHPHCRGVAIELKRLGKGAVVSAAQKAWIANLAENQWLARVCFGAKGAIAWLLELGYGASLPS